MAKKLTSEDRAANDRKWSELNAKLIEYSSQRLWGLVRNVHCDMAKLLTREDRHRDAVMHYLVVLLFDASGPENKPGGADDRILREIGWRDFSGQFSEMLPGITGRLMQQAEKAAMSKADIEELYRTKAARFHMPIMLLGVDETWTKIAAALGD